MPSLAGRIAGWLQGVCVVRGVSVVCGDRRCALGVLWCGGRRVWPVVAAALVFAVLAPVSGAVVKALGVDNWWWLVGIAAAVGAVGGVVVKHFASRWKRHAKERESRRQAVDRAALRLRGGRVRVRDIDDPTVLGCIRPGFRWG